MTPEAELHVAIADAWCRLHEPDERIKHPIRPYVLGPEFAQTVWDEPQHTRRRAVAVCARIVSLDTWELTDLREVKGAVGFGTTPRERLDPSAPLWQPIEGVSLGVHHWRLGDGMIELRNLGSFDQPPPLEFGRFAEEERRLTEGVRLAVERIMGGEV